MIVLALAAIALFGTGLAAAALPAPAPRGLVLGLGACLGAAAWSASYAASLFLFGADPRVRLAKDLLLALAGAFLLWRSRARLVRTEQAGSAETAEPGTPRWLWTFFILACLLASVFFLEHTLRFPDGGWDAWMIWNLRARWLARAGASFHTAFTPEIVFWAHQDYPLMVPGLVAQLFLLVKSESPALPALVAFVLGAFSVGLLTLSLGHLRGLRWGLLGGLALLSTPSFVSFTANQQSDVPLGLFVLCACVPLALALERQREPRLIALSGAAASMAAWTKNEGLLYLLLFAGALLIAPRTSSLRVRGRDAGIFLLGALPGLLLVTLFKFEGAHTNDLVHFSSLSSTLERVTDLTRWTQLAFALLRRIVYFQDWALFLVAEIAALVLLVPRLPARASTRVLGTALSLCVCAWIPMYILQPHPLLWFFRASIDRLTNHLWPAILLTTFLVLAGSARDPTPAKR